MRYQQQQKGLFTFYKEQELFQSQIEALRNKKKEIEVEKSEAEKKGLMMSNSKKSSPQKFKSTSQPAFQEEDGDHHGQTSTKIQQFGNSIVVINRKQLQQKDYLKSGREHSYQQKAMQSGYFIQNKNVQFEQLEKHKLSSPLLLQKRKKSYFRRVQCYKPDEKERKSTKLPALMKVEERYAQEQEPIPQRAKVNGSSLRYNGGDLMKYIRNNLHSQCQTKHSPEKSVSFFEYGNGYKKEVSPKKTQGLNDEQKRLLQILCRYRKDRQR